METTAEPKLAAPGAGLPGLELFVARLRFAWARRRGNRESFARLFERERTAIRALVADCEGSRGGTRVLIKRVRGMEDSSRFWSVWMTLDHLRIVNGQIERVIRALTKGIRVEGRASTAAVKPDSGVTAEVIPKYEQACDALAEAAAAAPDLRTSARYEHPWFGPLDAADWHALSAIHMGIHRRQMERIIAGLASAG